MTKVFIVNADDSISVLQREPEAPQRESRIPGIIKKLNDPNVTAFEVSHLISKEIALLTVDIQKCGKDSTRTWQGKRCLDIIETLRFLQKTAVKEEKIPDQLNFDGPKFHHCFRRLNLAFEKAVRDAHGKHGEKSANKIMENLEREFAAQMPEIRREVEEIGSSTGADPSQSEDAKNGSEQSG
jgi:hypothetical protein